MCGRQLRQLQRLVKAMLSHAWGQGAPPSGIRRGQDERAWNSGVPAMKREGKGASERQACHMRWS